MKHIGWVIILLGACLIVVTSCTDRGYDIDPRDGIADYDTIHPRMLTEDMHVLETIDSSHVIVRK